MPEPVGRFGEAEPNTTSQTGGGADGVTARAPEPDTRSPAMRRVQERFGDAVIESHSQHGDDTVVLARERLLEALRFLRDDPELAFDMLSDLTTVDYMTYRDPKRERFEVVYHLYSLGKRHRIRLKVPVSAADPEVDSVIGLWKTADWQEREAWDMFGIKFRGHPNLKRILTHIDFVGHPLRKDYPLRKRQAFATNDPLWDEMDARLRQKGLK